MKVTKVCCQGCGADLEIDENIRFVTCNYCHSRLEVVHDSSVTHTRQLEKIERTTDQLANNLKVIELQNDLERLDREWESARNSLLVRGRNGGYSEPSAAGSIIGGVIAVVFGIFWLSMATSMGAPSFFPLFGVVFIAVAIFSMIRHSTRAGTFQSQLRTYEEQRRALVSRIDRERRA